MNFEVKVDAPSSLILKAYIYAYTLKILKILKILKTKTWPSKISRNFGKKIPKLIELFVDT